MAGIADQMQTMRAKLFPSSGGGGNGLSMPTMASMPAPAAPAVPQYDDSAASNLAKITSTDSPLMKQAAAAGAATANRRGLLNSSIAVGASQAETIKAATPIATADAATNAQKNLQLTGNAAALDQIREQGRVTGGLQQQQQQATSQLSAQEAAQLSELEKQRAAATSDQQRADIQAQMDRLMQSQKGTSQLSAQEASQMAELERQRAAATTEQQIRDIDAQMARLRESGSQELTRLGAASGYEQQRIVLQGQIDTAVQAAAAGNQQQLAVLQGSIQSALQSQADSATMQRLGAQYAQELTVQSRSIEGDLAKIRASGNEDVRRALVAAETAREQLAMQLASNDRTNAANTAVQIFAAEAQIRSNLLGNSNMPAAERAAYEQAIASLGTPVRNFINALYGTTQQAAQAGGTTATPATITPTYSGLVQPSQIASIGGISAGSNGLLRPAQV